MQNLLIITTVFIICFLVSGLMVCFLISSLSDFFLKKLYLKDMEKRLCAIIKKHKIKVIEDDLHSKFEAYNPSIKESIKILEIIYGIRDNDTFSGYDFSEFQKALKNVKYKR